MADSSLQRQAETYGGLDITNQTSAAWHNRISLTDSSINYFFENPSPSGIPYKLFGLGTNYIGRPVTIIGANGYRTTGQAILDFAGAYPILSPSDTLRRDVDWESDYQLNPTWKVVGGYRYYNARGLTAGEDLSRHDNGVYVQINGAAWNRAFASVGLSSDRNSVFGSTTNPQASVAVFPSLRRGRWIDETRLRSSGGTALRDPDISQQQFSLYEELINAGAQSSIATLGVRPIHPQRGRSFDVGLDQYLVADRVRFSATVFDNHYYDLIEFVPDTAFPLLGIPPQAATLTLGAYLNSLTEKARGTELELSARAGANWQFDVAYTHLNARVLKSFSADALSPSFNRAFPNIPIGAYSPLVGARPFRRAPETGSARIGYSRRGWGAEANADFSSRRDDSTFLVDANFGTSMLLPNHDLAPAYADVNVAGFLRISPRITLHGAVDNVLNDRYQEVFGYPALGINARAGIRLSLSPAR